MNILVFANCHGALYKKALDENLIGDHKVDHVLSYENLTNFSPLKRKFEAADVLVIQPVTNYEDFKIENLERFLKPDCLIIKVPFVRFEGFWPKAEDKTLDKFHKAAVMFFPEISKESEIVDYLTEKETKSSEIVKHFQDSLTKLEEIEASGDVKFLSFFLDNYQKIPLFRDNYHPTKPFYQHLAKNIVETVGAQKNVLYEEIQVDETVGKEVGHYKPIKNIFAEVLGLKYDLSSYFIVHRHRYLQAIVAHENSSGVDKIDDLNQLVSLLKKER